MASSPLRRLCHWGPISVLGKYYDYFVYFASICFIHNSLTRILPKRRGEVIQTQVDYLIVVLHKWTLFLLPAIIKLITWAMVHLMGMWWPPHASLGGAVHAATFLAFAAATLYYFLQSLLEGPGFVPIGWKPVCAYHLNTEHRNKNF